MNINPGIGIDNFIFGMKQDEMKTLLGKPDRIHLDEEYADSEPMIQYNAILSRFTFHKDYEDKLGYI